LLEDYLLDRPVETDRIEALHQYLVDHAGACLRLVPIPGASQPSPDRDDVGELQPGVPYRLSLQAAIWHRPSLLGLVEAGESPWELELNGSARTAALRAPFFSVVQTARPPLSYFCTAIVKGVWLRDAIALCRREGIEVDRATRPSESGYRYARRRLRRPLRRLFARS